MINKNKLDKLNRIYDKGIDPFPTKFKITSNSEQIKEKYAKIKKDEHSKDKISTAGRIIQMRPMGKITFLHLLDKSGKIQVYIRSDDIGKEEYKKLRLFDLGDIIGVTGKVFKTKTGEITVYTKSIVSSS